MNLELDNKRVLITGASRGIGLAIAEGFLKENAQTCIVSRGSDLLYDNEDRLKNKYNADSIFALKCDCMKSKDLEFLKKKLELKWDSLDILVVNVGDGRGDSSALPDHEEWQRVWDTNFESSLNTSRIFLPLLEKSNGVILFISSIAGIEAIGAPTHYSTAKSAIIALSKNLAKKLAPAVRVNVLAPGNVYFKGGSWDEKIKQDKKNVDHIISSTVPMRRFASPEEIADAAIFLCSNRAKFITGSNLIVDGGQTIGLS